MESCRRSGEHVKGPWSPEEDEALQELVQRHGTRNWSIISSSISGQSGKSCRLPWCNQLSPQVAHRSFTKVEDKIILEEHHSFTTRSAIGEETPGRTTKSTEVNPEFGSKA